MRMSDWSSDVCSSDLHDLPFQSCEWRAHTHVDAFAKRHVPAWSRKVDLVGPVENGGIAVAGAPEHQHHCARRNRDAAERGVSGRAAQMMAEWRLQPQHFLHEIRDEIGRESCRERVCQYV